MNLLLLSYCFPPASMAEGFVTAKTMGALAHRTDVYCAAPGTWSMAADHTLDSYVEKRFNSIRRLGFRTGAWPTRIQSRLPVIGRRPDPLRALNRRLGHQLKRADLAAYDVMITRSEMHSVHLVGLSVKRARPDLPWVASFSDPWLRDRTAPRPLRWNARLERSVVEQADRLVFTSPEARDHTMRHYGRELAAKATVIPHSYDPDLYPEHRDVSSLRRDDEDVLARVVGNFSPERPPTPLVDGLRWMAEHRAQALDGLAVELVGYVDERLLRDATSVLAPNTLRPIGPVDYTTSLALMRSADALILVDVPHESSIYLPSKLLDYIGAERPVAALSPSGPAERLVREIGGWVGDPRDAQSTSEALLAVIHQGRRQGAGSPWSTGEVRSRYTATAVARSWDELLDGLTR